jgi:cellulose synthase/poly-beta-1,6-N-acetylglucosamine synthase-like glycosyltransferase
MEIIKCDCKECLCLYNQEDYIVNIDSFTDKNKIGVSGYLRLSNDAPTLLQCIESIINYLDELIIVYNNTQDNGIQIINKLQKKYPSKIKIFHYVPRVT